MTDAFKDILSMVDNACREIKSDRNKYGTFIDTTKKCRKQRK